MKKITGCVAFISLILFTSCVQSLHPIYGDEDITFDESVLGTWEDKNTGETWTFSTVEAWVWALIRLEEWWARRGPASVGACPVRPSSPGARST